MDVVRRNSLKLDDGLDEAVSFLTISSAVGFLLELKMTTRMNKSG